MSLQVWLPLTKDLRQQGLSDIKVENHNATLNTAGKLGSCYYFNGSQQWLQFDTVLGDYYNNDWSIACWLKPTDSTRSVIISEYSSTGASNVGLELTASRVVRLYWNGSPDINFTTAGVLPINEWTHLTVTKQARIVKVYFNGELKQTYTNSSDFSTRTSASYPRIGDDYRGNSGNSVSYQGYINDFRMYDHCLSPMEVKELAKGLVLHYPLNRNGWGQENLYLDSTDLSTWWYGSGATYITEDGQQVVSYPNTASVWPGAMSKRLVPYSNVRNKTITFSVDLKAESGVACGFDPCLVLTTSATSTTRLKYKDHRYNFTGTGKWHRYIATYNITDSYFASGTGEPDFDNCYFGITLYRRSSPTGSFKLKNPKIELGSIATPWCPNSSDTLATTMGLNSTTEYDCSGFCNNGMRTGTFTWTSDTPKYAVSTKITPNSNVQFTPMLAGAYSWTVAAWIKPTVANNDGKAWFSVEQNTYWQVTCYSNQLGIRDNSIGGTGTRKNYSFGTIAANTWVHLVATYDNGTLKLYNNGVLQNTNTVGGTYLNAMNSGRWGSAVQDGYYWNGQISDARIYATALSASDVKSLYQNCATIDPDGTIRGQIRS